MKQHKDDGLEERRLGLGPEWIGLMAVLGGGGLDKVIDQTQGVLFVPQVAEGVVPIRLLQVHQVEYANVIALAFQPAAGG